MTASASSKHRKTSDGNSLCARFNLKDTKPENRPPKTNLPNFKRIVNCQQLTRSLAKKRGNEVFAKWRMISANNTVEARRLAKRARPVFRAPLSVLLLIIALHKVSGP